MILDLLAFVLAPIDDNNDVAQLPILEPNIMNSTAFPPPPIIIPAAAIEMIIEVIADVL